jgi:hypothetical protein
LAVADRRIAEWRLMIGIGEWRLPTGLAIEDWIEDRRLAIGLAIVSPVAGRQSNPQWPIRFDNPQSSMDNRQSRIFNRQ